MNDLTTPAWKLYEAGTEYNRKIKLYETVRQNERFYRGEQWQNDTPDLPHPVFNLTRRIVDFLIGSLSPERLSIRYTDERMPYLESEAQRKAVAQGLVLLDRNAAYRWKQDGLDELSSRALLDAAISGDGIFYCWWDADRDSGQLFRGDIRTEVVDSTRFFVADPTSDDLQSQEWVMLAGRATVDSLRREALEAGCSEQEIARIVPDRDGVFLPDGDDDRATFLIRFFREDGEVVFEKTTRDCLIRRANTGMRRYPFASFQWIPRRGSYHGSSPVSELIPNQKYINTAYAMVMKHMSNTAFSKVVYDKSRIPEWSNEVGEAIAAVGGGNVSDAVSVLGVGQLQDGYLELIESVIENTKSLMGATESALGDERANNTSAILALQEASRISLRQVSARFCRCIGDLATVWADTLCAYCPPERLLPVAQDGAVTALHADYALLGKELLHAVAEIGNVGQFSTASTVSLLGHLLDSGHISIRQYLQYLPDGCLSDRATLLQEVSPEGGEVNEA